MAKCPYCGEQLTEIADGVMSCAKCKKKFRKRTATPATAQEPVPMPVREAPKAPAQATPPVPAAVRETRPVPTPSPISAPTPAPAATPKTGSAAEQEELAMLRARIAAMEAKQAELERGSVPKKREGGAGAAVISFAKKWGLKAVLPAVLVLIALITLLVCFCGVRGIYVNIDDPNEFYSFDATSYEYHGIFMGEEYVDEGTWKKSGGQLLLTYKDEDFGKVTESYDFSSLNSNKTLFISDDFGNKGEFKRVSLLAYGTSQKIKITLDGNGGSGGDSHKVQIGSKIQEPAEPTRDGYMFMGWYTSKEGWKNAEAKRIDFDDRVWEDVTYYANWKNTTLFNLTGDGLDEPVKFTEGDDVESLYMSARGWNSLPDGVTGLIFKDASGNEIDPSSAPAGNVTVTVISDYLIENGVLKYVKPGVNEFVIPDSVTSIGEYAFRDCKSLTSVTIPDSVTSIGYAAFYNCTSLTFVALGNGVTSIGSDAFWGCYKLVEVYNKSSLDVTAGSSDHGDVGYYAKHVYTEEGGSWLSDTEDGFCFLYDGETGYLVAYYGDETELPLPDSFTAYDGTKVTSYQIYNYAFYGRDDLTAVTILDSVTSIEGWAFRNCTSLTSITVPDSVTSIGSDAFSGCTGLTLIHYTGNMASWLEKNWHSNVMSSGRALYIDGTKVEGKLVIPNGIASIPSYAFAYQAGIASIIIPDGVTSIGGSAFSGCAAEIIWDGTPTISEIGDHAFAGYAGTSITIPDSVTSIGDDAFSGCTAEIIWGDAPTIAAISSKAFSGYKGTSLIIPDSVTSIGSYAFYWCTSLTSVTIGNGVTSIGDHTFWRCGSLTSVTIPDSVTSIGNYAFYDCTSLTAITIPDSVTSIGDYAFYWCTSLTSVTIPDSVTSIGSFAFYHCKAKIIWGGTPTITEIGDYAFVDYAGTSITIPDSVTSIGSYAFRGCDSLTSITIPDSVTSIGSYAFENCTSLTSVTIGNSVTSIGDHTFWRCDSLISVIIPKSVTSIGNYAFLYCDALTSVTFEGTMAEWNAVDKGPNWKYGCSFSVVKCSDGEVAV